MSGPVMAAAGAPSPTWTGPIGPVRLVGRRKPYQAPLPACAEEIRAIPSAAWTRLTIIPIIAPEGCLSLAWDRGGRCHEVCEPPGSVWFIDTDAPHMAVNASPAPRFHLVVDKFLDAELRAVLERGTPAMQGDA